MVVATDARPVLLLPFVAIPLAALLDNPKISLSSKAGSDLPTGLVRQRDRVAALLLEAACGGGIRPFEHLASVWVECQY